MKKVQKPARKPRVPIKDQLNAAYHRGCTAGEAQGRALKGMEFLPRGDLKKDLSQFIKDVDAWRIGDDTVMFVAGAGGGAVTVSCTKAGFFRDICAELQRLGY
jgi:hypothetical protein